MGMDDMRSVSYGNNGRELYFEGSGYAAVDSTTNDGGLGGGGLERPTSNPSNFQDLRCYSASYATGSTTTSDLQPPPPPIHLPRELKKGKSTNGSFSRAWCFSDPELQRKRRVASYKVYTAEGKMKGSLRKSFKWVKERYSDIIHGWRS